MIETTSPINQEEPQLFEGEQQESDGVQQEVNLGEKGQELLAMLQEIPELINNPQKLADTMATLIGDDITFRVYAGDNVDIMVLNENGSEVESGFTYQLTNGSSNSGEVIQDQNDHQYITGTKLTPMQYDIFLDLMDAVIEYRNNK